MSEDSFRDAFLRDRVRELNKLPFRTVRENGMVHVDAAVDAAFRKALLEGIPLSLRSKMREALAASPGAKANEHSIRYFGGPDKIAEIKNRIAPLLLELNHFLTTARNLPGLFDWLQVTNFGADYRMIKAFLAWAELAETPSLGQVPAQPPRSVTYG
jgi:hypothetical protein